MSAADFLQKITAFRDQHIIPNEAAFNAQVAASKGQDVPILESLRALARKEGLWNLCIQDKAHGPGLTNAAYAPLAEVMGCNEWAPEVFNCNPPDSGNIGVLMTYASDEQKKRWLTPLLAGDMRSCFAMSEPGVASSDATNISLSAARDGDSWVLNGEKWWVSGPGSPNCKIAIVMCRTDPAAEKSKQHSMILVPMDTPGFSVLRQLSVFGFEFLPRGFSHLKFDNVRVPATNVIGAPGIGFEIAQSRLGPARLHHAMRCIGAAERALELACKRAVERVSFGKPIAQLGGNSDIVAQCRIDIDLVRAFAMHVAGLLDTVGAQAARTALSQIKVAAPNMACRVLDQAMQMHGAMGFSQDTPLAQLYARLRTIRMADGPDAVHLRVIGRTEFAKYKAP